MDEMTPAEYMREIVRPCANFVMSRAEHSRERETLGRQR